MYVGYDLTLPQMESERTNVPLDFLSRWFVQFHLNMNNFPCNLTCEGEGRTLLRERGRSRNDTPKPALRPRLLSHSCQHPSDSFEHRCTPQPVPSNCGENVKLLSLPSLSQVTSASDPWIYSESNVFSLGYPGTLLSFRTTGVSLEQAASRDGKVSCS